MEEIYQWYLRRGAVELIDKPREDINVIRIHARHRDIIVLVTYSLSSDPSELVSVVETCLQEVESFEDRVGIDRIEIWTPGPPPNFVIELPDKYNHIDIVWRDMKDLRRPVKVREVKAVSPSRTISMQSNLSEEQLVRAVRDAIEQSLRPLIQQLSSSRGSPDEGNLSRRIEELERRIELLESVIKLLTSSVSPPSSHPLSVVEIKQTLEASVSRNSSTISDGVEEQIRRQVYRGNPESLSTETDLKSSTASPVSAPTTSEELNHQVVEEVDTSEILKEIMENPWVDILRSKKGESE